MTNISPTELTIQPLDKVPFDFVQGFSCGNPLIHDYLKTHYHALRDHLTGIASTRCSNSPTILRTKSINIICSVHKGIKLLLNTYRWTVMELEFKGFKLGEKASKIIASDLMKPRKDSKETKQLIKQSMELIKQVNRDKS